VIARYPARISGGWPLKPYAIAHSRFREVLYLDADTVPLTDPRPIFEWDAYRQSGMLTWPDVVNIRSDNPIWQAVGLEPRPCTSIDSAILVVDKKRAWEALDIAVLLNEHAEDIYRCVYGDKDTFLLAELLVGRTPTTITHRPFVFDTDFVQRDPAGDPILHHRTGSKWNLTEPNRPLALASLMPSCDQALAELREQWNGVVFHLPERSARARAEEQRLLTTRLHHYETSTLGGRRIEFLAGGRVGEGCSPIERHWAVIERDGALVLQFFSATRLTVELTQAADDSWQGRCITSAAFSARMVDEVARRSWPHDSSARVAQSGAEWVTTLLQPELFAAGFDQERAQELCGALSLLNDRFDDVPERLDGRLASLVVPERWQLTLAELSKTLASRRNDRIELSRTRELSRVFDNSRYDRVV
jgi:hypothetical protein